jgi:hypothetical protein
MVLPTALVIGNCTHFSLAEALKQSRLFSSVDSIALYSASPEERRLTASSASSYDYILTLNHGSSFDDLSTNELRRALGSRVVSVATPYFSGLFPDMAYLTHGQKIASCPSVLGDYHSALLLAEVQSGRERSDIVERYVSGEIYELLDIQGVWHDSLAELRERDSACSIHITPFLEDSIRSGTIHQQFLTFNHPAEGLISYIANEFIRICSGSFDSSRDLLQPSMHCLYGGVIMAVHPAVLEELRLPQLPAKSCFKQPDELGGHYISLRQFAELSVDYMRTTIPATDFAIHSPRYLIDRIKKAEPVVHAFFGNDRQVDNLPAVDRPISGQRIMKVVIVHFGRSGSTVISQMLGQHSNVTVHGEIFTNLDNQHRVSQGLTSSALLAIINGEIDSMAAKDGHQCHVVEVKPANFFANPYCTPAEFFNALVNAGDFQIVFLRRVNTLMRIMSDQMSLQSGTHHLLGSDLDLFAEHCSERFSLPHGSGLVDWATGQSGDSLSSVIANARAFERQIYQTIRMAGPALLNLTYEEHVYFDPSSAYMKILDFIGLDHQPAESWLLKTTLSLDTELENSSEVYHLLENSSYAWMANEMLSGQVDDTSSVFKSDFQPDFSKPVFSLCKKYIPLESLRAQDSSRWAFRESWSGDSETDLNGILEALHSLWDSQSVAFMVDLIPYFLDILRNDDKHAYWITEPMTILDVGARTAAGSDLLGSMFFGGASRRRAVVDVLDIDPTFAEYVRATKRFVRNYIISDIADIASSSYDYVFASHVIEHIANPVPFCHELRRIARKKVICYVPYDEIDPIFSHFRVDMKTLHSIGAENIQTTDKSWHWKDPNKHQFTAFFCLDALPV